MFHLHTITCINTITYIYCICMLNWWFYIWHVLTAAWAGCTGSGGPRNILWADEARWSSSEKSAGKCERLRCRRLPPARVWSSRRRDLGQKSFPSDEMILSLILSHPSIRKATVLIEILNRLVCPLWTTRFRVCNSFWNVCLLLTGNS